MTPIRTICRRLRRRAFELRGESELLRRATRNADDAEQLAKAVGLPVLADDHQACAT